jgi:hypothetical protein
MVDGNNILKKYQILQMQDFEVDGFASDNFGQNYQKHYILF